MPLLYLRQLATKERTELGNRHLARYLAFIAGAVNAGGLLAVHQYTSHMSGIVSAVADNVAIGSLTLAADGSVAVASFLAGAFCTTLFIRWGKRQELHSQYALPLLAEAVLLLIFGVTGTVFNGGRVLGTVMLLCFTMGLQNAMITKLSNSVIRTTHLTGMITDIGISFGRLVFPIPDKRTIASQEFASIRLLSSLILAFFLGGITGALGFTHVGFLFTLPLSGMLLILGIMPVIDDLRSLRVDLLRLF
jgi:uncharacterized membrane protein YoaK (UPF0700 family)